MTIPKKPKLYTEAEVQDMILRQMANEVIANHFGNAVTVIADGQKHYLASDIDKVFKKMEKDKVTQATAMQKVLEDLKSKGVAKF
jgi:hypothetical protein